MHAENFENKLINYETQILNNFSTNMHALHFDDYNRNDFLLNSRCSAFSIPSCSFAAPPVVQAEINEAAKAAAVTKELAFGSKIFEHAILQDHNRKDYNPPSLTSILPLHYRQILIEKLLMQSVNFEEINNGKIRTREIQEQLQYANIFDRSNSQLISGECHSPMLESAETMTVGSFKQPESKTLSLYSKNKLGRTYNPGRPLGMHDREKILELYQKGFKISHIAKIIGVTHSCVSKIMTRYRKTGSMRPKCGLLSQKHSCSSSNSRQSSLSPARLPNSLSSSPALNIKSKPSPLPLNDFTSPYINEEMLHTTENQTNGRNNEKTILILITPPNQYPSYI